MRSGEPLVSPPDSSIPWAADSAYLFDLLDDNGRSNEYAHHEGKASAWHFAGQTMAFAAGGLLATVDLALPYLVTIAALVVISQNRTLTKVNTPACIGQPFVPER